MSTKFLMTRDIAGYNGFGIEFSDTNFNTTLATGVAQSFAVPTGFKNWIAIFNFTAGTSVWVANNTTAAIAGASFALSASQLNPQARKVHGGDVISFITGDTASEVQVALYAIS